MSALLGTFVKIGTMADGTPRIVLDLQCTLAEVAAMGLMPGAAFGIARITGESTLPKSEETSPPVEKQRAGQLCVMACNFCADPLFRDWIGACNEDDAKAMLCNACRITSRKELDSNSRAAAIFMNNFRAPFLTWKESQS